MGWVYFTLFIIVLILLDLKLFHKKPEHVSMKDAIGWSLFWISLAMFFNLYVYWEFGLNRALTFLTGYVIEKSLSVDNIFVFLMVFKSFQVPSAYQHRVLFWGIFGALILRAIMILVGIELITTFEWMVFVFGGFLVYTGVSVFKKDDRHREIKDHPLVKMLHKLVPISEKIHEEKFMTKIDGKWHFTPLLLCLVVIEFSDVVFALDSIPAILAISTDSYIVYTSNIFAILGLRALYFILLSVSKKIKYLDYGVGLILCFVGAKMICAQYFHMPVLLSLAVIASILLTAILASLWSRSHP